MEDVFYRTEQTVCHIYEVPFGLKKFEVMEVHCKIALERMVLQEKNNCSNRIEVAENTYVLVFAGCWFFMENFLGIWYWR